jgi:hypothetical protein
MYRMFYQGMNEHLAYNKKVQMISPDPIIFSAEDLLRLTDGIRASNDSRSNWLGFQGKDLDVIIDLGKVQKVKHLETSFYQLAAWLSLAPRRVLYFISADGKTYIPVGTVENTLPIDQYDSFLKDFIVDFIPADVRYIRVVAHTIGNTPESHPGAGQPAWMHLDEVVVE